MRRYVEIKIMTVTEDNQESQETRVIFQRPEKIDQLVKHPGFLGELLRKEFEEQENHLQGSPQRGVLDENQNRK